MRRGNCSVLRRAARSTAQRDTHGLECAMPSPNAEREAAQRREVVARRSAEAAQRRMAEARSLSSNTSATTPRPSHSIIRSHMANENSGIHTGNVVHLTEPAAGNSHRPITQREVINNIAYLSRRYELGRQNAATANEKQAIAILGETGTGKSTATALSGPLGPL